MRQYYWLVHASTLTLTTIVGLTRNVWQTVSLGNSVFLQTVRYIFRVEDAIESPVGIVCFAGISIFPVTIITTIIYHHHHRQNHHHNAIEVVLNCLLYLPFSSLSSEPTKNIVITTTILIIIIITIHTKQLVNAGGSNRGLSSSRVLPNLDREKLKGTKPSETSLTP